VNAIREDHVRHGKETIQSKEIMAELEQDINMECENLIKVLESAQYLEQVEWRAQDRIISKGEKLACRFMTALLKDQGVEATYIDMSNVLRPTTTPNSLRLDAAFYGTLATALGERVLACGNSVPVITGYFGNIPNGLLDTIGRGYTDLCAALVAVGIKAQELQVWKEVDGIFTADPRKVPTARLLPSVTPSEAAELTFYGSEVIHPFTMEQVIRARIPIRIKNVINPSGNGTVIYPDPVDDLTSRPATPKGSRLYRQRSNKPKGSISQGPKRPTAVTIKHNIVILNVHSNKRMGSHGFMKNIFSILDRWHLTVDLISTSEVHVSMALHSESGMLAGTSDEMRTCLVLSKNSASLGRSIL
jgi:aspartate kinase